MRVKAREKEIEIRAVLVQLLTAAKQHFNRMDCEVFAQISCIRELIQLQCALL